MAWLRKAHAICLSEAKNCGGGAMGACPAARLRALERGVRTRGSPPPRDARVGPVRLGKAPPGRHI